MAKHRIPVHELRRLTRALTRFEGAVERAYPGYLGTDCPQVEWSDDKSETVRNALTALTHVPGWIAFRLNHRKDPDEPLPPHHLKGEEDQ